MGIMLLYRRHSYSCKGPCGPFRPQLLDWGEPQSHVCILIDRWLSQVATESSVSTCLR